MSPLFIGVSLKMYFGHGQTMQWCRAVADIATAHPATRDGHVTLVVLPSFLYISEAVAIFADTPVEVGGQDLFGEDGGAFTGEISGKQLRENGCTYAEIGHAERRSLFFENDTMIAAKTAAAYRNDLTPILCVGEALKSNPVKASEHCRAQINSALSRVADGGSAPLVVAYEPNWAIGAPAPASPAYVARTCAAIREHLDMRGWGATSQVIYGGSAGPGLLAELNGNLDGLFLGRFAHDPAALERVLTEALECSAVRP